MHMEQILCVEYSLMLIINGNCSFPLWNFHKTLWEKYTLVYADNSVPGMILQYIVNCVPVSMNKVSRVGTAVQINLCV
jgi:hypothetical protein